MRFMRNLREKLEIHKTHKERAKITPLDTIAITDNYIPMPGTGRAECQYSMGVTFGRTIYAKDAEDIERMQKIIFEDIAYQIYGGMRERMNTLKYAIYQDDRPLIEKTLNEMYQEMEI